MVNTMVEVRSNLQTTLVCPPKELNFLWNIHVPYFLPQVMWDSPRVTSSKIVASKKVIDQFNFKVLFLS